MATSDRFVETRVMLTRTACPVCEAHGSLELRLFCERGEACQHIAVCAACTSRFEVTARLMSPELQQVLPHLACPECGKKAADVAMVCELLPRACDTMVVCASCGHAYANLAATA